MFSVPIRISSSGLKCTECQAEARTLVDIVVTHDLRVTFTDDRLNAQIQSRRSQNDLDRGRSIVTSEQEKTAAQKRGAGGSASGSTPERKTAVHPDGKLASQQTGEVFVDCGAAPFDFDKKNDLNYFVRTIPPQADSGFFWGKVFRPAWEKAGQKEAAPFLRIGWAGNRWPVEKTKNKRTASNKMVESNPRR